jgi:hypothetical protein
MKTTKEFVKELLAKVEETRDPFVSVGNADMELICAANNLSLAIWQPTTRQVYVRVMDCERYIQD